MNWRQNMSAIDINIRNCLLTIGLSFTLILTIGLFDLFSNYFWLYFNEFDVWLMSVWCLFDVWLISIWCLVVECHIGQPCNSILRVCIPISSHVYCDANNTCRCKKEYPIVVGPHTCLSPKRVFERCSHPEECHYNDKNSHCNQSPYSSKCECNSGFVFDKSQRICVSGLSPFVTVYHIFLIHY